MAGGPRNCSRVDDRGLGERALPPLRADGGATAAVRSVRAGDAPPAPRGRFAGALALDLLEADVGVADGSLDAAICDHLLRLDSARSIVVLRRSPVDGLLAAVAAAGSSVGTLAVGVAAAQAIPLVDRALRERRAVDGVRPSDLPPELRELLDPERCSCAPIRNRIGPIGAILFEHQPELERLPDADRVELWKVARLASIAHGPSAGPEEDPHGECRLRLQRLTRYIHDEPIQRLFGASLVVAGDEPLDGASRQRVHDELTGALAGLRKALADASSGGRERPATSWRQTLAALDSEGVGASVRVEGAEIALPDHLEELVDHFVLEALRNATKHAEPRRLEVTLERGEGVLTVDVVNDGLLDPAGPRGVGLRLLAAGARERQGSVESGPHGLGRWRTRLTVPTRGE